MKTVPVSQGRLHGSILMMTMIVTFIVGFVLASYLYLIRTQNLSVAHSQAWNAAIAIAEAGVEEGMAQLNAGPLGVPAKLATNGWSQSGANYSPPQRTLGRDGYYNVRIVATPAPTRATIYATGYATVSYSGVTAVRAVKVTATNAFLFNGAVAVEKTIDLNGNSILIDSYDSSDSRYSTAGKYDRLKARDKGDVATNSGLTNSISVGNAKIKGKIRTGPTGLPSIGSNGSVGSSAWVDGGKTGIQDGWWSSDMNVEFPDVSPPFTTGAATPTGKTFNGTNYMYVLGSDNYQLSSLTMKSGDRVLVAGSAVLYVTGNVLMSGGEINIVPGAKLKIYVGGTTASFSTVNNSGSASSFEYFGLPSNTILSLSGNDEYVGTFYAPQANVALGGGGSGDYDFQGAMIVKSLKMNGHFKIHYDEALARRGPLRGYVATSWTEL